MVAFRHQDLVRHRDALPAGVDEELKQSRVDVSENALGGDRHPIVAAVFRELEFLLRPLP